jgi:hypothetical protein
LKILVSPSSSRRRINFSTSHPQCLNKIRISAGLIYPQKTDQIKSHTISISKRLSEMEFCTLRISLARSIDERCVSTM